MDLLGRIARAAKARGTDPSSGGTPASAAPTPVAPNPVNAASAPAPVQARREKGAANWRGGAMAEEAVALHYAGRGCTVLARRWRSAAGEIDLVVRDGEAVVAVEVKRARTLDAAAGRLSRRQRDRLCAALALFCEGQPAGAPDGRRLDLALVDGMGRVAVRENAWGEDW